jgi:chromosomal replication initiation ATPase DnaA
MTDAILTKVCEALRVKKADVLGTDRYRALVDARFICWLLLREHTKLSKSAIARKFNRSHTTVISGLYRAKQLLEVDAGFQQKYSTVKNFFHP